MAKHGIIFGDKHWKQLTKNSKKVVKGMNDVLATSMLESALKLKGTLDDEYTWYIEDAKNFTLEEGQVDIYNRNSLGYHETTTDLADPSGGFNTLRGTDTSITSYVSYNKNKNSFTVGVAGPDILYMEYGAGDIGDDTENVEARNAAKDLNLKPYNSGSTIRTENGFNYWIYHSSVHFGIPTGAVAYTTFQKWCEEQPTKIIAKTPGKQTISGYLQTAYRGKDIK